MSTSSNKHLTVEEIWKLPLDPPKLSDAEMIKIIETAVRNFSGQATTFESAIGALVYGRMMGWKALRVMHSSATYSRYEKILGIKFIDVLPDRTTHSRSLRGIRMADTFERFWQAINGGHVDRRIGEVQDIVDGVDGLPAT
jgi:hypothetical protein